MIGLMYLLFFSAYALISLAVVVGAVKWARKRGRSTFRWGFAAAFIMYNLVFWDWIPSIIQHEYYCRTKAGFWVYKTLDQWKAENPGILEALKYNNGKKKSDHKEDGRGYTNYYYLNNRFYVVSRIEDLLFLKLDFGVRSVQSILLDLNDDSVLAKYVGFTVGSAPGGLRFWKVRYGSNDEKNELKFFKFKRKFSGERHIENCLRSAVSREQGCRSEPCSRHQSRLYKSRP